jgi:hypothetical protein
MADEIKKTMQSVDGNTAAAMESYYFTEVAAIYPITPSSPMAETVDVMASKGRRTSSALPSKSWRCSPKPALLALSTEPYRAAL